MPDSDAVAALLAEVAVLREENARLRGPYPALGDAPAESWPAVNPADGLLHAIAEQALDALAAARCSIWLIDAPAALYRLAACAGLTPAEARMAGAITLPIDAAHLFTRARSTSRSVVAEGAALAAAVDPAVRAAFALESCLIVPIDGPVEPIGAIYLDRLDGARPWSDEDRRVAEALAGQVTVAVDSGRRYAAERQRAEYAEAMREGVRELAFELDHRRRLEIIQQQVGRLAGRGTCWVALRDDETGRIVVRTSSGDVREVDDSPGGEGGAAGAPRTMLEALLAERLPILTADYAAECARRGIVPAGARADRAGLAWFGLPILDGERPIGALAAWRPDGPIPADTVALLTMLSGLVASALASARPYADSERERREEVVFGAIARDLASAFEGDAILRTIVEHAWTLLRGQVASIYLYEPGRDLLRCAASRGLEQVLPDGRTCLPGQGVIGAIWQRGEPLLVGDYLADPRVVRTPEFLRDVAATNTRSMVGVPIFLGDDRLGVLTVSGPGRDQFTARDAALLARLAALAALAVRNARLYTAERERATRAETLREIGRVLSAELDLDRFLDTTWQQLTRLVEASGCWLALWDERTGLARFCLYVVDGERHPEYEVRMEPGASLGWELLWGRATIRVTNYAAECRRRGLAQPGIVPNSPDNAWLGVPLLAGDQLVGALAIWRYGAQFDADTAVQMEILAGQVASALANARLYREAERRRHEEAIFSAVAQELASPQSGERILERIAGHARALFDGRMARILRFDPRTGHLHRVASSGTDEAALPLSMPADVGIAGHVWQTGQPFFTTDYRADRRFVHSTSIDTWQERAGLEAAFGVPITLGDERLGVLLVGTQANYHFDPHHEVLLVRLADQAALGIQNARLYAAARARADRLEVLNEAGRELSAEIDFDRFLGLIWRQVNRITALDGCWIALWHEAANDLELCLYVDRGERRREWERTLNFTAREGLAWAIIQERAPLRVDDYLAECRRRGLRPSGSVADRPAMPWLGLPLVVGGRTIGAMAVWRWEGRFGDEELTPLGTMAGQIAATLENARLYREARTLASTDPLTGLLNHRHAQERLDQELARAARHGLSLAVVMLDLNNFKLFNDTFGHPAGDEILRTVAAALRAEGRAEDVLGRYGGDEFLLVLPETDATGALALVDRVQARLRHTVIGAPDPRQGGPGGESDIPLQISAGIAVYPSDGLQRHELIALADGALYASKRSGGRPTTVAPRPNWAVDGLTVGSHTGFDVVEGLVLAVDGKDHYTVVHSQVVADTAVLLAEALGLPAQTLAILRAAGLLHDVGKISIPDRILRKPAPLNREEWEIMRQHVEFSELIIRGVPGLREILEPVMHHHERWDGRGYPRGLAGEAVPLLGRIMIIADAYSAMTLDRPYRRGLAVEQAVEELRAGAGSQFDPRLVALLCDTLISAHANASAVPTPVS